jgi:Tfp pilus assembly protein FimT
LVEVLLVLAIVVIVAALIWPTLEKPLAYHRLHSAADEVRTEWCQARIEAMRSGHTYAFRYEVGGDHYYTEPDRGPEASTATGAAAAMSVSGGSTPSATDVASPGENKTLPTGVKFVGQQPGETTTAAPAAASAQNQPAGGWSEPIFFYPDGTASDVQLILGCNQSCALRVMLRGSTATATVADAGSTLE